MENASKALVMAAAVIIAVLLLALVFVFFDDMAGYFSERHDVTMTQQTMQFNSVFENYSGKTIRGNELISIMNRVINYNNYESAMVGYDKVLITINLKNHQRDLKGIDDTPRPPIFASEIKNNGANGDEELSKISAWTGEILSSPLGQELGLTEKKLQQLTNRLTDILEFDTYDSNTKAYVTQKINDILNLNYTVAEINPKIHNIEDIVCKYNQISNFKKAKFKCINVEYNQENRRVNKIDFEVVLKDGKIQLD